MAAEDPLAKQPPAQRDDATERPREGQQRRARRPPARGHRGAYGLGPPLDDWVAKVSFAMPARRAASITLMTLWCAAVASADTISIISLEPPAAAVSSAASASTL